MNDVVVNPSDKAEKAGYTKAAVENRCRLFAERYLSNGNNATEAAKFCGLNPKTAKQAAMKMMKKPLVMELIGSRTKEVLTKAKLSTERWANEMACIGHLDPGELYDANGNLIPLHNLPEHVRRAISSIDIESRTEGKGEDQQLVTTTKIKMHDKNVALANIGKHLGVFAEDNQQSRQPIQVLVQLVG